MSKKSNASEGDRERESGEGETERKRRVTKKHRKPFETIINFIFECFCFNPQACSRQLITNDLDLSEAQFVQFYFRFGCKSVPGSRDEGVIMDYSRDGGITWNKMMELFYDMYKESR